MFRAGFKTILGGVASRAGTAGATLTPAGQARGGTASQALDGLETPGQEAAEDASNSPRRKQQGVRIPLRYQVLLPMLATMLITLAVISLLTAAFAARRATSRIEADVARIASTLRATTFPLTDPVLETIRGLSGAELLVTDSGGARLASTALVTRSGWMPSRQTAALGSAPLDRVVLGGAIWFHHASTLLRPVDRGRPVRLHVLYPERAWREARRQAMYPPLAIGGLGAAATALLSLVLSRRVTGPIARIADLMTELAAGSYHQTAVPQRNDELRDLTLAANHLAAELDGLHQAIRRGERLTLLGQLSGGLAHQMRNSAAGARLAMQLHRRRCSADDQESIDVALRQLELVEEQLVGFLTLGKPQPARRDRCDLAAIMADVERLVAADCKHRGMELTVSQPARPVTVCGDASQLRQMLVNLTLNALDAAGRGGRVRIALEADAARVRLAVCDSGPGVPDEIRQALFEPFVTTKPEGIGLGLAVANRIALAHGGELCYRREAGQTRFEVDLPIVPCAGASSAEAAEPMSCSGQSAGAAKEAVHVSSADR